MYFDEIIYGTQYYRTPTPLPEEWEKDISNMEKYELDAFQIRINWRWNERIENEYDFSDVDRLMELAEKYNRKVIIKFLLECAPQYIFDKYDGVRIGPKGEVIRGGAHGAFYGGWRPCFTNPKVRERAILFVEKVAERYSGHKNLILWNAWNEIRNRPVEDCFCPHCRKAFGEYLRNKYQTIEKLNEFYGAAEESFEAIALPAMPHATWDIYEFKQFKGSYEMYEWLDWVKQAIRKYDKVVPVMAHVGVCSAFQKSLADICDDYVAAKAVDFWGTSIPCSCAMGTESERLDYMMLNSFIYSIDKDYFMHEIYPGHGRFHEKGYDTPFDMRFKLYGALAGGTKGFTYWQYRSERLGIEVDCAGIMHMDGEPRPVAEEVRQFGKYLHRDMKYFTKFSVKKAEVAILFDFNSQLISEIEDSCGELYDFSLSNPKFYYRNAHAGIYRLAKRLNYHVEYLQARDMEQYGDYKVICVPYGSMITEEMTGKLAEFTRNGGILILDEGFAMRQSNTWVNPYELNCKELATIKMKKRRGTSQVLNYKSKSAEMTPYKTEYDVKGSDSMLCFENGETAIHKVSLDKGTVYLLGFSLGYSYYKTESDMYEELFEDLVSEANLTKLEFSDFKHGIYTSVLETSNNEKIIILFNVSGNDKSFTLDDTIITYGGDFETHGNVYRLKNEEMGYLIFKN